MPAKRKAFPLVRNKAVYKKHRPARVPRNVVARPFPARKTVKLTYCEVLTLNPVTGYDVTSYAFRCNSIFDPNITGAGHQPYAHDTYQSMYTHYSVKSSTIDINFADQNTGDPGPAMVGCFISDTYTSGSTIVNYNEIREMPGGVSKMLTRHVPASVRHTYVRDTSFPVFDQGRASAIFGDNPVEAAFFNVYCSANPNLNNDDIGICAFVRITYDVEMWEPKKLGLS